MNGGDGGSAQWTAAEADTTLHVSRQRREGLITAGFSR